MNSIYKLCGTALEEPKSLLLNASLCSKYAKKIFCCRWGRLQYSPYLVVVANSSTRGPKPPTEGPT